MAYEQKDMSGSLFKNDKRENDQQPNGRGSAKIDGVEYWMDAWTKTTKNGEKWQSFQFKRKDAKPAPTPEAKPAPSQAGGFDDLETIPF